MPAIRWRWNCPSAAWCWAKQGRIAEIALRERLDAHRVVEDFMIAANVAAAKALESKAAPVVYRIHEPPSREKLMALKDYLSTFDMKLALGQVITPGLFNRMLKDVADEAEKALIMEAVLRSQTQAYYGPQNAGHFGLALGSYAHFTSPIRRYADLLVHRALVDAFGLEQPAPKGNLKPGFRPVGPRPRRSWQSQRCDQRRRAPRDGGRARDHRPLCCRLAVSARGRGVRDAGSPACRNSASSPPSSGLAATGWCRSRRWATNDFVYDEKAQVLVGKDSGTRYAVGDRLRLRLAEANALTGALKFELEEGGGRIEPRGRPQDGKRKGGHLVGRRGRPANIRHQGRRK